MERRGVLISNKSYKKGIWKEICNTINNFLMDLYFKEAVKDQYKLFKIYTYIG